MVYILELELVPLPAAKMELFVTIVYSWKPYITYTCFHYNGIL